MLLIWSIFFVPRDGKASLILITLDVLMSSLQTVDLVFSLFYFSFLFSFCFIFYFLFLE